MRDHFWVSMTYHPITAEVQEDGSLHTFAAPEAIKAAEDEAFMGCWFCLITLDVESFGTECDPEATLRQLSREP